MRSDGHPGNLVEEEDEKEEEEEDGLAALHSLFVPSMKVLCLLALTQCFFFSISPCSRVGDL